MSGAGVASAPMKFSRIFLIAPLALVFVSCSSSTLAPSGFLGPDDSLLAKNKKLPFGRSWKNPEADLSKYSKIAVSPMKTDRLRGLGKGLSAASERNLGDKHAKDGEEFATFATGEFQKGLDESDGREAFVQAGKLKKSKGLMILETNLVEVVPGNPIAQVVNFVLPFASALNRPSVGIEGRFVDAGTGKTLFAFSDRETPEISLIDRQRFSYYGTQRREAGRWADQLRKVVEGNAASPVKDAFLIQPIGW